MSNADAVLFHGSNLCVTEPNLRYSRKCLDFGSGFYTTNILNQARNWAISVANERGGTPYVTSYLFKRNNLNGKSFRGVSKEWAWCIVAYRMAARTCSPKMAEIFKKRRDFFSVYDYIEGEVADDDVFDSVERFCSFLSLCKTEKDLEMSLGILVNDIKSKGKNHQLCLKTRKAIDALEHVKAGDVDVQNTERGNPKNSERTGGA